MQRALSKGSSSVAAQRPTPCVVCRGRHMTSSCRASSAVLSPARRPSPAPQQWRTSSATPHTQQTAADTAARPPAAPAPQRKPNVLVDFSIQYATSFGQELCICGAAPELGSWQPAAAVPLTWHPDNTWRVTLTLAASPRGTDFEYKYIIRDANTGALIRWQDGNNLQLHATASPRTSGHYEVTDSWCGSIQQRRELQHHAQVAARSSLAAPPQLRPQHAPPSSNSSSSSSNGSTSSAARNNITSLPPGWRSKAMESGVEVIHLAGAPSAASAAAAPAHKQPPQASHAPHFWAPGLHGPADTPIAAAKASLSTHDDGDASSSSAEAGMLAAAARTLVPAELATAVVRPPPLGAVVCAATHLRMCQELMLGNDAGACPLRCAKPLADATSALAADAVSVAGSALQAAGEASADVAIAAVAAAVELGQDVLDAADPRMIAADRAIAAASRQLC